MNIHEQSWSSQHLQILFQGNHGKRMDFHVASRQERDEEMLQRAEQRFSRAPRLEEIAEALEMFLIHMWFHYVLIP